MVYKILIVDDIEKLCKIIVKDFEMIGHSAYYATTGGEGGKILRNKDIDVVLLDIKLENEDGIDVLREMKKIKPAVPVFVITGHGTISNAVQAIKNGAYDYIQKPVNFDKLLKMVENVVSLEALKEENENLRKLLQKQGRNTFITANEEMLRVLEKIKKFSKTEYPVLITGESGTGKEIIAEYVHMHSKRNVSGLYKVNCAAFSESLLDDELFGHYKGAFTGADSDHMGIFEKANKSTLLLDEIGDMPLSIQAKILRTLQNREVRRLGGNKNILVDVRFIAATNKDIHEMVSSGSFRDDLYFRLNTFQINIPPLRERQDDITLFIRAFLKETALQNGIEEKQLDPSVEEFLLHYSWPGNVRELRNVINYAHTISSNKFINMIDLPNYMLKGASQIPKMIKRREDGEKFNIIEVLEKCKFNKTKAAEMLNISRRTLYNKMTKYGIHG